MNNLPSDVQRKIKADIERNKCPEHGEHPTVTFTSKGFNVSCCCTRYESIISKAVEKAVGEYIQREIAKAFKGFR